jgi:hypothetical protein
LKELPAEIISQEAYFPLKSDQYHCPGLLLILLSAKNNLKALSFFCNRLLIAILFFVILSSGVYSQSGSKADTTITLITSILKDGTRIWGTLKMENDGEIVVFDFNLGEVRIAKKEVTSEERQKVETAVIIETTNNASYFGFIIRVNAKTLVIKSPLIGTCEIQSNTISRITLSGTYVNRNGRNWFSNPNATRYFFAPSAIPLRKKEGYFQNAYLLANSVNVGVTNNITLGGGVVIPFLFYVTPKISRQVYKNLYLGAGILFTQAFITDLNLSAGIGYGLVTVGNHEHNATLGCGYGFSKIDSTYKATKMPIVTLNGMTRIGKRLSVVTENWLMPRASYKVDQTAYDPQGMPYVESVPVKKDFYSLAGSVGLRFMPGMKTSVDFSVVGISTDPNQKYMFLPYLDFVYKFN